MADDPVVTPTSLSEFPTYMNGTALSYFPEVENSSNVVENVNQSEGGRDIVQVVRADKLSSSFSLVLADFSEVQFYYQLSLLDSFVFKQYSPLLNDYVEKTVRLRDFKYKNKKHSDVLDSVIGVWEVSFTLLEF